MVEFSVDWANHLDGIAERDFDSPTWCFRAYEHSVENFFINHQLMWWRLMYHEIKRGENGLAQSLTVQKVKSDEGYGIAMIALIVSFGFSTNNKA